MLNNMIAQGISKNQMGITYNQWKKHIDKELRLSKLKLKNLETK